MRSCRELFGIERSRRVAAVVGILFAVPIGSAQAAGDAQTGTDAGIDPIYVGSLLSPSPAVPRAGLMAFEPYVIGTRNPALYGLGGGLTHNTDTTSSLGTFTLIKYGFTDHLTFAVFPQSAINRDAKGFDSGSQVGDLPIELEYRFIEQDKTTGKPSATFNAGIQAPVGRYDMLPNASDGQGNGTYRARTGLTLQSLIFGQSEHPIRLRGYSAALIPLATTDVHGISTFGTTDTAFAGTGRSGINYTAGASIEYSVTRKFVLALDIFYTAMTSTHVYGTGLTGSGGAGGSGGGAGIGGGSMGGAMGGSGAAGAAMGGGFGRAAFSSRSGFADTFQLVPQVEYSLGPRFGIVTGIALSVEGHNTAQVVQPQIAFLYVFDTSKGISTFFNPYTGQ